MNGYYNLMPQAVPLHPRQDAWQHHTTVLQMVELC